MAIKYDEKSCGIVLFRRAHSSLPASGWASAQQGEQSGSASCETKRAYQISEPLFLILRYPGGHFDFPKGHMEKGETETQTAIRELIEETEIRDVKILDGFRHEISYMYRRRKKFSNKLVVFFLGETETCEIKISDEHLGYHWLNYHDALAKLTFENAKNLLEKAAEFLGASK